MQVEWARSNDGEWFELDTAPIETAANVWGVYVIWTPNSNPELPGVVLKVGSGNIPARVHLERLNPELRWIGNRTLLVTWAAVNQSHQLGVVRYLSDRLSPYFPGASMPDVEVTVNLPLIA